MSVEKRSASPSSVSPISIITSDWVSQTPAWAPPPFPSSGAIARRMSFSIFRLRSPLGRFGTCCSSARPEQKRRGRDADLEMMGFQDRDIKSARKSARAL